MEALVDPVAHAVAVMLALGHLAVGEIVERFAVEQPVAVVRLALQPAFRGMETRRPVQLAVDEGELRGDLAVGMEQGAGAVQLALPVAEAGLRPVVLVDAQRAFQAAVEQVAGEMAVATNQVELAGCRHALLLS